MDKANWDAFHTKVFCEICMEETQKDNRPLGCLNRKGYKHLEEKFFALTKLKLSKKQFKNKWAMLKKEYTQFMELKIAATGLGWDEERGTIGADDDWWELHLQNYPKHAKWRNLGPPNLKEMDVMFSRAHVTGETANQIINTNVELLALQNLQGMYLVIQLVTLGELASAPNMYQHLHPLVRARHWVCEKLTVLEGFSWLALSLQGLRQDLQDLQPAMNPHAALQGPNSVLLTFVQIKQLAVQLERAKTEIRFRVGVLARQVKHLGKLLKGQSDHVLLGSMTIAEFQARIPGHLVLIDNLLHAGMQF